MEQLPSRGYIDKPLDFHLFDYTLLKCFIASMFLSCNNLPVV